MNKTLRTFIIIAAMLVATGQTWAALTTGTSNNLFVEPATGGTVTLYDNQGCTGDPITNAKPGNTVYLKAVPDIIHGYPTTSIITVEKIVDSGAAQSRGTRRISAITIGLGEYVEVTAVGQNTGIFSFTMPDDGASVSITVTFPDAPVSYINEAGQTVNTGNETVHILTGSETELDAGWYVAGGTLDYSQPITLNGDVHLILHDGTVMNIGTEESPISGDGIIGTDRSFCIYAQSTGDSKGQLYVNATVDAIFTKNVTICGGQVTANGKFGIYALNHVIVSGGQLTATGSIYGFFAAKDLTISGGQVTVNGNTYGIYVNGNLTLGWTNASDFIYAGNYYVLSSTVSTATGNFAVYDGETLTSYLPSGTLTYEQVLALGDKTLRPVTTIPVVTPQSLAVSNVTRTGATLTWMPGGVESQWQVAYSIDGGTTWSNAETVTETTYTMTGLPEGTAVTVRVRSYYNDNICSDFATSTFTTTALPLLSYLNDEGQTRQCADYTVLTGSETELDAGWYVADGTLNYSEQITLNGDVHLILKDGAVINVGTEESPISGYGIIGDSYSFCIYAQSTGNSKGQLYVNATDDAIFTKNVTICGGLVTASGNNGIYALNNVIISGGQVTASGISGIRAINHVIVSGGQVTATGSTYGIFAEKNLTISGGQVTANGGIIIVNGNLTLGWTNDSDFIYAESYYVTSSTVSTAAGNFAVYDGGKLTSYLPSGTLTDEQVSALGGKTLRPVTSIPVETPQNLVVSDVTRTGATLTWVRGGVESQWQVAYSIDGGNTWSNAVTVTETTYTMTGLPEGTAVTVRVRSYYNDNICSDFATSTFTTTALPLLSYLDDEGQTQQCKEYTVLTGSETGLDAGWYVAEGTLNYSECIRLNGDVHLILKDGAVMNVGTEESPVSGYGIIGTSYSFCIYAQSTGNSKGQLYVNATDTYYDIWTSNVTINGGEVKSEGFDGLYIGGNLTINGGQVTVKGGITVRYGTLTMGWTSLTDFIKVGRYISLFDNASIVIAEGKPFAVYNNEKLESYLSSGTHTDQYSALAGKTLRPVKVIPVEYVDDSGKTKQCTEFTVLKGSETSLSDGWYVAEGTLNYSEPITLSGDVHLILKDGAVMNVGTEQTPIHASECISGNDHSLSIYAQSTGGGKLNLYANPTSGIYMKDGNLTINGGEVTTTGTITIDGGTLTLGWTGLTDFIKATSYSLMNNARVAIAEGKAFKVYDGESFVAFLGSGTLTSEQVAALGGKTLRPSRTSTLEAPQNLVASMTLANTLTSARLMWQSDGEASSWQLATSTDGGTTWSSDETVTEPAYSVTELPVGTTLTVRVRSVYSETLCSDYATSTFNALSPVAYIDAEGYSQLCSAYTTLTGMETSIGIPTDTEGITNPDELKYEDSWYLASGNIGYVAGLTLEGNVHLILADGARVSFYESDEAQTTGMPYSIYGFPAKLNIYGQQAGSGSIFVENPVMTFGLTVNGGQLLASCDDEQNSQVAIMVLGDLTVNGGVVYSESDGTAIATMEMTPGSSQSTDIIINGGKVTAYGTQNGLVSGGDITINGGVVKGSGKERILFANGDITINGGQVTASNAAWYDFDEYDQDSDHSINLWALGNITLGWSKASDFIQADKYYTQDGTVSIADGKTFCDDDGNIYSGTQTFTPNSDADPDDIYTLGTYAIDGKILRPDLVHNLKATVANGVVTFSWTGSKESYNLRYRETSAEAWTVVNVATRTYTPSGLKDDAQYICQVQGNGEAEWSDAVYFMPVVTYIGKDGSTQRCSTYKIITGTETAIDEGWYVAFGKTDYGTRISMNGNVHLILADDAEVNFAVDNIFAGDGFELFSIWGMPCNLTIYGQSEGTGTINSSGFVIVGGELTVNGGTLNVTPEHFVDGGAISCFDRFIVNGGTVFAQNPYSAIVVYQDNSSSPENNAGIIINGGQVTAISGGSSLSAFDSDIIINGGQVTAQIINSDEYNEMVEMYGLDDYKTGMLAEGGNITLGATKASDFILATNYVVSGTLTIADGKELCDEDGNRYSGTQTLIANPDANPDDIYTAGTYAIDGKTLRPATPVDIALTDNATDNASVIEDNNEALTNVTLSGRTLYKDGAWNTLCLPFALSTEQVSTLLGSNGQLMELDTKGTYETDKKTGLDGTTLYLYFKAATTIAAGKPYIIRWEGNGGSDNIVNPVFTNVVIDADAPTEVSFSGGKFVGTYDYMEYDNENKSILLLGLNNTLYYPQPSGGNNPSIGACRAYFHIDGYVTGARLSFGEAESQGIKEIEDGRLKIENGAGAVYDLQGRRMDSSILNSHSSIRKKGLYIVNGRKVVVR